MINLIKINLSFFWSTEVKKISEFWKFQSLEIMIKFIYSYAESQSGVIPYIDEINQNIDFKSVLNKEMKID